MGAVISSSFLRSSTFLPLMVSHLRIPYLEAYSIFGRRPQVEDALVLDLALLRKSGALTSGARGELRFTELDSIMMECLCGIAGYENQGGVITLYYGVSGKPYMQVLDLQPMQLYIHAQPSRLCLMCPRCRYRGYKLYLSQQPYFLCRTCQNLNYELQTAHYGSLSYLYLQSVRREREHYLRWKRQDQLRTRVYARAALKRKRKRERKPSTSYREKER
jgi:hypothetical protein